MQDANGWVDIARLDELPPGSLRTVRRAGHQLVVGRTADGEPFALDNRCPHEGYPLAQGFLKECLLTCAWHNWKFDVRDGSCVLGGEAVRRFPTRVEGDTVAADLTPPPPEEVVPPLLASLREGLYRYDNGRSVRDTVRLLECGVAPERVLYEIALHDARHAEYGTTHVLAVAADCARLLERYRGADAAYAIAPVVDLCGDSNERLPERAAPEPARVTEPRSAAVELREAVEAEDVERSEALLRGAFAAGLGRVEAERWLFRVMSDHFTDFGHQLIYLVKGHELCERLSDVPEAAAELYPALLYSTALGTREDTLPYWRGHAEPLTALEPELPSLFERADPDAVLDQEDLVARVLDGRSAEAFEAVHAALARGVPGERIGAALVHAAAERLARFDAAIDRDPDVAESWLWATHRLTFASAVRHAQSLFREPATLRFLFQAAAFVNTGRAMDAPPERRHVPRPVSATPAEVVRAIAAREPESAVGLALGCLEAGEVTALRHAVEDLCLADPVVRPIVVAHAIKTAWCGFEEHAALGGDPLPVLAALRFLASPVVERRVHATVRTSIAWVKDGVVPRKLTQ